MKTEKKKHERSSEAKEPYNFENSKALPSTWCQ